MGKSIHIFKKVSFLSSQVRDLVADISVSSIRQGDEIVQISHAMNGIDSITRKKADQARESAKARGSLRHDVEKLENLVEQLGNFIGADTLQGVKIKQDARL